MIRSLILTAALCIAAFQAQGHEFWIDAEDWTVPSNGTVTADFRNGEKFAGSAFSYIPRRSVRFDMAVGDAVRPVPARLGDSPAFAVPDLPDGLLVILHETADSTLTYGDKDGRTGWERFLAFGAHKDFGELAARHDSRGLPREGVRESYRRYAKALVAVGDGAGSDRAFGLRSEIVALANPYADEVTGGLPVRVLWDGAARADAQVELFARRPDGTVEVTLHRTDADGVAVLPVAPGHVYLADAVVLEPLEPAADGDPVWGTHWAALTFAVPEG
ncbi:DUF4198 domain-containing protein [Jannaschia sp. LMIT008]|uniref:DUF4198 domain-containing protein n=1 Tax=Jannaschia maritima TaxID=3032585 RepID=UPI002810DB04|nr:DUF4198 domain-containing protein [Jannaschia sp. LMIT008]